MPETSSAVQWALGALAVGLPHAVLVVCFSTTGIGLWLFSTVAIREATLLGAAFVIVALTTLAVCYVLGLPGSLHGMSKLAAPGWSSLIAKFASVLSLWLMCGIGFVLLGVKYPWASMEWVLVTMLFALLGVRRKSKVTPRPDFLRMLAVLFIICAAAMFVVWLEPLAPDFAMHQEVQMQSRSSYAHKVYTYFGVVYVEDCTPEAIVTHRTSDHISSEARDKRESHCMKANNVIVICWAMPLAAGCIDFACFIFFYVRARLVDKTVTSDLTTKELQDAANTFFILLTLLIGGLYVSSYVLEVSVNVTMPLMGLVLVGLLAAFSWIYVEGCQVSDLYEGDDGLLKLFGHMRESSNWVKAMAVGSGFIPLFYVLESARERLGCLKRGGRLASNQKSGLIERVEKAKKDIDEWNKTDILVKICILGELYFMLQVLGTKFTYVFLSWMNEKLDTLPLQHAVVFAFLIGFSMFMLPPVPGVPVYIFCGIVVSACGEEELSFWGACALAVFLGLLLKLVASTGQYFIGRQLGQFARVKLFIGMDKPVTKAIQAIVRNPSFSLEKVAVLVGGPDWPTSVMCGIMQVDLKWMLLGTLPCFFTASPCVLAGAFLTQIREGEEDDLNEFLGSFFSIAAACIQVASMVVATACIGRRLQQDDFGPMPEIADRREIDEFTQMRELEERIRGQYLAFTDWRKMSVMARLVIGSAAAIILVTGYAFVVLGSLLFENFSVSGRIADPIDEYGLNNHPLAIVKAPGWIVIGLFMFGVSLHMGFVACMRHYAAAAGRWRSRPPSQPGSGSDTEEDDSETSESDSKGTCCFSRASFMRGDR